MTLFPRRFWQDMTTLDFANGRTDDWIAVLPVAAIEQHGPHLPVATDTAIMEGQIARVVELAPPDLPLTFLPVQQVGKSNEHISSPGTLTLDWETATKAWLEIGDSVARAGVRKLIVVSSHGGNTPMVDIITRELRIRHEMLAVGTHWARFGQPEGVFPDAEFTYGIHGGDVETSIMLHLRPDLVRMEMAEDFRSTQLSFREEFKHLRGHGPHQFGWKAQDLNAKGAVGDASAASAKKGEASLEHAANGFIQLAQDVHEFDLARLWSAEL